jgi:multiple sugar transport system permease protein
MTPRPAPARSRSRRETLEGLALVAPLLALVLGFAALPVAGGVWLSLTDAHLLRPTAPAFVGLGNYRRLVGDGRMWGYALNTAIWAGGKLLVQLGLALGLALLLNRDLRCRGLWRTLVILPWAMPAAVTGMTWRWILDGQVGVLNRVLLGLGVLREPVTWLADPVWMWPTVIAVHAWQFFPFMYLAFLAGLQLIPREAREAAEMDGAGAWRAFRHVTWPLLRPVASVNALLGLVWGLGDFSAIWTLTQGGPGGLTMTLAPVAYLTTFRFLDIGYGASLCVALALGTTALSVAYLRRAALDPPR